MHAYMTAGHVRAARFSGRVTFSFREESKEKEWSAKLQASYNGAVSISAAAELASQEESLKSSMGINILIDSSGEICPTESFGGPNPDKSDLVQWINGIDAKMFACSKRVPTPRLYEGGEVTHVILYPIHLLKAYSDVVATTAIPSPSSPQTPGVAAKLARVDSQTNQLLQEIWGLSREIKRRALNSNPANTTINGYADKIRSIDLVGVINLFLDECSQGDWIG